MHVETAAARARSAAQASNAAWLRPRARRGDYAPSARAAAPERGLAGVDRVGQRRDARLGRGRAVVGRRAASRAAASSAASGASGAAGASGRLGASGTASSARRAASASASAAGVAASRRLGLRFRLAARGRFRLRGRAFCLRLRRGGARRLQAAASASAARLRLQARRLLSAAARSTPRRVRPRGAPPRPPPRRAFRFRCARPRRRAARSALQRRASAFSDALFLSFASKPVARAALLHRWLANGRLRNSFGRQGLGLRPQQRTRPTNVASKPDRIESSVLSTEFRSSSRAAWACFRNAVNSSAFRESSAFAVASSSFWPPFVFQFIFRFLLFLAQGVSIRSEFGRVVVVQCEVDVGVVASFQMLFYGLQDSRVLLAGLRQGIV